MIGVVAASRGRVSYRHRMHRDRKYDRRDGSKLLRADRRAEMFDRDHSRKTTMPGVDADWSHDSPHFRLLRSRNRDIGGVNYAKLAREYSGSVKHFVKL